MTVKKNVVVAVVTALVGVGGVAGVGVVSAADNNSTSSTDPMNSLVQKIASKFNLNKSDVQAVFDQDKTDRQAEQTKNVETELSSLVTSGKITEAQKKLILDKRTAVQKQHEADRTSNQTKTDAERKASMDKERTDLTQWAKDNGISEDYLKYVMGGHGGHGGPGGPGDRGQMDSTKSQ